MWSNIGLHSKKGPAWGQMGRSMIRAILNSARNVHPQDNSPAAANARRIAGFQDLDGIEFLARIDVEKDAKGEDRNVVKLAVEPDHKDYAALMGAVPRPATGTAPATLDRARLRAAGASRAHRQAGVGTVRGTHEVLGLHPPGPGLRPHRPPLRSGRPPALSPRLGVLLPALPGRLSRLYGQRVDAERHGQEVAMIDASDVERAAMQHLPQGLRQAAEAIGFAKPLGGYSEAEALQVIDAIVTVHRRRWSAHHEATKHPPVRGLRGHRSAAIPSLDINNDLPWETDSHDRLQRHGEHFRADHRPGRRRSAAGASAKRRRAVPRRLAAGRRLRTRAAVRVRQGAGRPRPRLRRAGCCASSSAATSWRTAWSTWLRAAGFDLRTRKANGEQFGFSVADGRLQGHVDGVIVGGPEGFAYPALWETSASASKSWRDLEKNRLAVAKPVYAAQVALYQAYLELHEHPALFTALNADTMEIYAEWCRSTPALAQRMSDRAAKVITATEAGELLPRAFIDPAHFECRMCAWQDRCWKVTP